MLMPELPYPSKTTKGDNDWNKIYETLTQIYETQLSFAKPKTLGFKNF